eukprot:TRINITY_DN18819_c0_g1_i1.p1 TRINITY_DN18819_c0_g1~~TRINITY_DN18819_c0_g1_i1.p1  ORF type:complete len:730 (-),score=212.81 TRINITY_DN18819_c0_g1_i1:124-2313(-)
MRGLVTIAFALLVAVARAGEVTEPFLPAGCLNEYTPMFMLDTPHKFSVLQIGIEVQAPEYEAGEEVPELWFELQRRTPLAVNASEGETTQERRRGQEYNPALRFRSLTMRRPFGVASSSSSSSSSDEEEVSSAEEIYRGDTFGKWVLADDTLECPVAATRFKCVKNFYYKNYHATKKDEFRLVVKNLKPEEKMTVCLTFHMVPLGPVGQYQHFFAAIVFVIVFAVLAFEMVSRALVTMIGDIILFGLLWAFQQQPTLEAVLSWLDWRTMVLLASMMMAVAIFADTGFFEFSAWQVLKFSRKKLSMLSLTTRKWIILLAMGAMTFMASAFLDNCTTVLLFGPVTVRMAQLLEADPMPLLMTMIFFCTLGGATTYVGDPPNLIIGGQFELGFNPFIINCAPPIFIILLPSIGAMWLMFRKRMQKVVPVDQAPRAEQEGSGSVNGEAHRATVNEQEPSSEDAPTTDIPLVERHAEGEAGDEENPTPSDSASSAMSEEEEKARKEAEMDAEYRIKDKTTFYKSVIMLSLMLVFFLLESVTMVSTTWVAVVGAGILLLITSPRQIAPILEKIEWPTLYFFAYLFIFVKLVEKLGVIFWISESVVSMIESFPPDARLPIAMMVILWISALLACWCNNIAFTASIIPLIYFIANKPGLGVPLRPLAWSLALGVAMSANATVIAAAPNLIVAQIAGRAGYKISFIRFLLWGFPFMLFTTVMVSAYLLVVYWLIGFSG